MPGGKATSQWIAEQGQCQISCPRPCSDLTTSTAPARTLGSLPMMDTLAAKEPSMLNTTNSVPLGSTVM